MKGIIQLGIGYWLNSAINILKVQSLIDNPKYQFTLNLCFILDSKIQFCSALPQTKARLLQR